MNTDPALSQVPACSSTDPNSEDSFHFTPIKALRALPRIWERKPSTPFRNGPKSKKLWKRFQSSCSTMKTLDNPGVFENDALQTAIDMASDTADVRGVKRLCVGPADAESADRVQEQNPGRSFLETKWGEASRKRRKLPDAAFNIYDERLQNTQSDVTEQSDERVGQTSQQDMYTKMDEIERDLSMNTSSSPTKNLPSPVQTAMLPGVMNRESPESPVTDTKGVENRDAEPPSHEQSPMINNAASEEDSQTTAVQDLTNEQEGKLVRSALRSSLDGEDALLLNDFLSKAKAKRAAKAATANSQANTAGQDSSPEESPEESTPRSRRTLGDIDANSPSPVKGQTLEDDNIPGDEALDDVIRKDTKDDEVISSSPTCRRSSRIKGPPADAPSRNTISLRRAKGTEFVFLQRTEAQELALATKRNTRKNKGNSVFPKHALQAMADQESEAPADKPQTSDHKGTRSRPVAQKHVSWNEERLVEYEDDEVPLPEELKNEDDREKHDVGSSSTRSGSKRSDKKAAPSNNTRSSRQKPQKGSTSAEPESDSSASTTASASTASPRSRRVRRPDSTTGVSGTPVKTGSGRISKPPASLAAGASTPTKGRRKLVPKSPSSSMLPAPSSKPEQTFVSGIPTRSASNTGNSEGAKRKSMVQASAGCTPMPRRVRART